MGMQDAALLGVFAAIAVFGYYMMVRLDGFLEKIRKEKEKQERLTCFNLAISGISTILAVSTILKENKIHEHEQEAMNSFDWGDTDATVLSAEFDLPKETLAQWECIAFDKQPGSIDQGTVEEKAVEDNFWN